MKKIKFLIYALTAILLCSVSPIVAQTTAESGSYSAANNVISSYGMAFHKSASDVLRIGSVNNSISEFESSVYAPATQTGSSTLGAVNPNYENPFGYTISCNAGMSWELIVGGINVSVAGATSGKLIAWIDFDENGVFDSYEASEIITATTGQHTYSLRWTSFPNDTKLKLNTYMRIRLTTDAIDETNSHSNVSDGEVEDYVISINFADISKTAVSDNSINTHANINDIITYTINLTKNTQRNITVFDPLPEGTTFVDADNGGVLSNLTIDGQQVSAVVWSNNIAVTNPTTYNLSFRAKLTSLPANTDTIYNVAFVTAAGINDTISTADNCNLAKITVNRCLSQNDTAHVIINGSVNIDVLSNDMPACSPANLSIDTVSNSGLHYGSLKINTDNTITYTANKGGYGIDSVEYRVVCGSGNLCGSKAYMIVSKPLSNQYKTCQDSTLIIGMNHINGVEYFWYDAAVNGNQLRPTAKDTIIIKKDNTPNQSWYVEARYNGKIFSPRYHITVSMDSLPDVPVVSSLYGNDKLCGSANTITLKITNPEQILTYQWYKNDNIIAGATGLTLTVNSPGTYKVRTLSTLGCPVFSAPKTITQDIAVDFKKPVISSASGSTLICGNSGSIALKLINSTDYVGATYKWYKNDTLISNATSTLYIASDSGKYHIAVTVGNCIAASEKIQVTKDNTISITKPTLNSQDNTTALCGTNSKIRLYVSNATVYPATAMYVWYKGDVELTRGAGMTNYITDAAGDYKVYVYENDANNCGSLSNVITLTQGTGTSITKPAIISVSGANNICGDNSGIMLELTTIYSGTTIKYQWFNGTTPIANATNTNYYATAAGSYKVLVTVDGCSDESNVIAITKNSIGTITNPILNSQDNTTTLCGTGSKVRLYVSNATLYPATAMYVWYKGDVEISRGAGMTNYITDAAGDYKVYVYENDANNCGSLSNVITITSGIGTSITKPAIVSVSGANDICGDNSGIMLELTTVYSGTTIKYQWFNGTTPIANATNTNYYATVAGNYKVLVTVDGCSDESNVVAITKNTTGTITNPILNSQDNTTTLCGTNSKVRLFVSNATAYPATAMYVWYKGNVEISRGAGMTNYITDAAGDYKVYVYENNADNCGSLSNVITLTQGTGTSITKPAIISVSGANNICGDNSGIM
ncbi:MAG: GEVED domain-containing protein, partial [Prevotellaceae bacterium]|nr:GEVED domain-containing protein [Prevotellaceae bacterium]